MTSDDARKGRPPRSGAIKSAGSGKAKGPSATEKTSVARSVIGRHGPLTGEDRELWQRLAHSIEPIHRMKQRVPETERSGLDAAWSRPAPLITGPMVSTHHQILQSATALPAMPAARTKAPPPLAPFDRKRSRRIASGRIEIEARLDLHGARQIEAHSQFRWFIVNCVARGFSTVLVVTGKGGRRDDVTSSGFATGAPERGVLRRSVPMWLDEPELRALVASYTTADIKHGGDGALYIHLRKRASHRQV